MHCYSPLPWDQLVLPSNCFLFKDKETESQEMRQGAEFTQLVNGGTLIRQFQEGSRHQLRKCAIHAEPQVMALANLFGVKDEFWNKRLGCFTLVLAQALQSGVIVSDIRESVQQMPMCGELWAPKSRPALCRNP